MDRNELKVKALLERVSVLTSQYENQDADRRVEITVLTQQVQDLQREVENLRNANVPEAEFEDVPDEG